MKKTTIILVGLIIAGLLITSCQKAKETEKKEAQVEKQETQTQKKRVKQESQPKQEQPFTPQEAKEGKKEKPVEIKPSPLTEEDQRFLWKMDTGPWNTPNVFKTKQEAIKYLKILLKGDHAKIIPFDPKSENYSEFGDSGQREVHAELICSAIHALVLKQKEQKRVDKKAFELVLEVLKKKKDYPKAYACASKYIGWHVTMEGGRDEKATEAIPLLKEAIKHSDPKVRLHAAGSLFALGEPDIALPVLDELARQGEVEALPLLFEPDKDGVVRWSKLNFWDKRGLEIIKRAIDYPSDEVKGWAAIALISIGIEKEKVEEVAFSIVKRLMYKTKKDYGFKTSDGPKGPHNVLLPEYEGKNIRELEEKFYSDGRACDRSMAVLGRLKSKRAVPMLKHIKEKNTKSEYVCWDNLAEKALKRIHED